MTRTRLDLTRPQILAFRRHAGGLDERLPHGRDSLRRAGTAMTVQPWRRLSHAEKDAVVAEAETLPLPDTATGSRIVVRWDG